MRTLSGTNLAHIDSGHTHPCLLGKFEFGTPVYAHTGLGTITYDTNDYLGVGTLAGLTGLEETENIVPAPVRVQLDGLNSVVLAESLDAASYGDRVTFFIGYRNDDGTLIDNPWTFYKGRVDSSSFSRGKENSVSLTIQHDLAVLAKKIGTKYTDEEQQRRYVGDNAFKAVEQMQTVSKDLVWGSNKGSLASIDVRDQQGQGPGTHLP